MYRAESGNFISAILLFTWKFSKNFLRQPEAIAKAFFTTGVGRCDVTTRMKLNAIFDAIG